ncbi:WG repeat-containing protein [Chryseobacterium oryctis]|uniref:WG repeat-containing protein n=1 Tax=Chryseobacterium oryctis TaxID=2952618 RepID=A0ABT3HMD2_9FLAO|nr:WG repeat-containing protein [Chryseobacterium oryctis]MCW3160946.1 WG repeat-containing protein [Chryseobacterium oryctis]
MKNVVILFCVFVSITVFSQAKIVKKNQIKNTQKTIVKKVSGGSHPELDLTIINEELPALIPKKKDGKFGYINQKGKFVIQPEYHIAVFFYEDCNLLNSPNEKIRKFGTNEYATVEKDLISYRINRAGKRVYQYKTSDLGKCQLEFKEQQFQGYVKNGFYGIIEKSRFFNAEDYRDYQIYPQYEYLHIMEGDDVSNPMIVASHNDRFGVIDIHNKIIIPFEYDDIKRNFSWKLGKMFEVSKDGVNYYYIDSQNNAY